MVGSLAASAGAKLLLPARRARFLGYVHFRRWSCVFGTF